MTDSDVPDWDWITWELVRRDGDRCAWCGTALHNSAHRHHRLRRRDAKHWEHGEHNVANLVLLHPACHQAAHNNPTEAKQRGIIVAPWDSPTEVPVTTPHGTWLLTPDGTKHRLP